MTQVTCSKCQTVKPDSDFPRKAAKRNGLDSWCKECKRARERELYRERRPARRAAYARYRAANPDKVKRWNEAKRLRVYGLTLSDFQRMLTDQMNACAICAREVDLVIDHCHETGRVRGLLCHGCNLAIGHLPTPARLHQAATYLEGGR